MNRLTWVKKDWSERWLIPLILLGFVLALLCGAHSYQGWGGDYAGYLTQTRSIVQGTPVQPFYVYNPAVPYLAPPYYPLGYSIFLVPFYRGIDNDALLFYSQINSALWGILGLVLFAFLRKRFNPWGALMAVLFLLFNPYLFEFKNFILPDILCMLCILLAAYWYQYRSHKRLYDALLCGFFAGYAWLSRANGVAVVIAIVASQVILMWNIWRVEKDRAHFRSELRYTGIVFFVPLLLSWLVNRILFTVPGSGSYLDQLQHVDFYVEIPKYIIGVGEYILRFYQLEKELVFLFVHEQVHPAVMLGGAAVIGFMAAGLLSLQWKRDGFMLLLLLITGGIICVWPMSQGFRYLLPVFALLPYFLLQGIEGIPTGNRVSTFLKWAFIPIVFGATFLRVDKSIAKMSQVEEAGGPQFKINREAFNYIRENISDTAIISTHHPLILGLYAERKSAKWASAEPAEMEAFFKHYSVDYLLVNNWLEPSDPGLKQYLEKYGPSLDTCWRNERNILFKWKK